MWFLCFTRFECGFCVSLVSSVVFSKFLLEIPSKVEPEIEPEHTQPVSIEDSSEPGQELPKQSEPEIENFLMWKHTRFECVSLSSFIFTRFECSSHLTRFECSSHFHSF